MNKSADHPKLLICYHTKVYLENGWTSKRMITEGDAAIPLETTRRAFRNQEQSKQRSAIVSLIISAWAIFPFTQRSE